eukprot:Amastigsp_a514935_6.p2 type:complete len:185 gc:universal Amastigsp_a514935_6:1-555(+)
MGRHGKCSHRGQAHGRNTGESAGPHWHGHRRRQAEDPGKTAVPVRPGKARHRGLHAAGRPAGLVLAIELEGSRARLHAGQHCPVDLAHGLPAARRPRPVPDTLAGAPAGVCRSDCAHVADRPGVVTRHAENHRRRTGPCQPPGLGARAFHRPLQPQPERLPVLRACHAAHHRPAQAFAGAGKDV